MSDLARNPTESDSVTVSFLSGPAAQEKILNLIESCDSLCCAVAWATENDVSNALLHHAEKISKIVVGTHLFLTSPAILDRLAGIAVAKAKSPDGDLFHPKVYFFRAANRGFLVVGSHNLTQAAFGSNVEASTLIEGPEKAPIFGELCSFIVREWESGRAIDPDFLFSYRIQHRHKHPHHEKLRKFEDLKRPRNRRDTDSPLLLSWEGFLQRISHDPHHTTTGRIRLLKAADELFAKYGSLAKMPPIERRKIAGTQGSNERQSGLDWGWFGQMSGSGTFAHLIIDRPDDLSGALDYIPPAGPISSAHYQTYIRAFKAAFAQQSRQGQLPTATRLLAMKRPDYFVCVNSANRDSLCERFGIAPTSVTLESYWAKVVQPIMNCPWWLSHEPPKPDQAAIWRGRAALLDVIYYEPKPKK